MANPAPLVRMGDLETTSAESSGTPAPDQAAIDAAHGTTGWNAYDVWRSRIFSGEEPVPKKAP